VSGFVTRGRPLRIDEGNIRLMKHRFALAQALMDCSWDLPVTFRREDDVLIGTCLLEAGASMEVISGERARVEIPKLIKSAILTMVYNSVPPP
jgi:hypothetical protein